MKEILEIYLDQLEITFLIFFIFFGKASISVNYEPDSIYSDVERKLQNGLQTYRNNYSILNVTLFVERL